MKPNGLPKTHLLRKSREFNRVYRSGKRLRGFDCAMIYLPNQLEWSRLGISVQRKVGGAVRRNRIKRIIREVFRTHKDLFPRNADVVIAIRPGFSIASASDFRQMLASMTSKCRPPNGVQVEEHR